MKTSRTSWIIWESNNMNLEERLGSFLDETFEYNDLPGLAVGVYCGGTSLVGVRGYADYVERVALREDDIFHCASVSKLFTSSAIMRLVEAGVLDLDDRLVDLLPDLHIADNRCESIRLRHMLTHTSGIGDCYGYHWDTPLFGEDALENYVYSDEVCLQPMLWDPGTEFRYSNMAFEILGHIASVYSERMPGGAAASAAHGRLSYEDVVARYCMEPAGMNVSTMKTFERDGWKSDTTEWVSVPSLAVPHRRDADRSITRVQYYPYNREHAPSSTLTASVADLLKWGRVHLNGSRGVDVGNRPMTEDSPSKTQRGIFADANLYKTIWQPYATVPNNGEKIGIGWFIRKQKVTDAASNSHEFTLYGHEGSDDGFRSSFWICPELDMVTVVLSNLSDAPVKRINKKLFTTIVSAI